VLVPIEGLFARGTRATEVVRVKRRLRAETSRAERDDARAILDLKLRLAAATGSVSSCASCAAGKPSPRGIFAGGDCCSSPTDGLFDDVESAALAQAGTRPRDLVTPRGEHAGCAFRGATGCTLATEHRPTVCVRYACDGLRRELHRLGRLDEVEQLANELRDALARFAASREARIDLEIVVGVS
jgi:hypothetical protein